MNTLEIVEEHKRLWRRANSLNPAFKSQGSKSPYDEYNEAIKKAHKFDNKQWERR